MSEATSGLAVEVFGATDVGIVRFDNEDSFAVGDLDADELAEPGHVVRIHRDGPDARGPLLIVCDGMGGAAAGEIASELAVEVVFAEMRAASPCTERAELARVLRRAVRTANRRVFEEASRSWKLKGMGTTLSAAAVVGTDVVLAQIGDSRVYVLRGHTLVQVTRDQSVVSALLHAGRITEEEAENFAQSNVILQALGVTEDVDVALSFVDMRRGDRLLLCSDGLHGVVDDDELAEVLADADGVRAAADALVRRARDAGGPDNITAIVAEFDGDLLDEPASPEDLPRFAELDPTEEGERAISTTSRVARRLAAKAGVGDEIGPRPLPATGQHRAIQDGSEGPVAQALAERSRIGLVGWAMAIVAAVAIALLLLLGAG